MSFPGSVEFDASVPLWSGASDVAARQLRDAKAVPSEASRRASAFGQSVWRLAGPTAFQSIILTALFLGAGSPFGPHGMAGPTPGAALLSLAFFSAQVTGRRFGPSYGSSQIWLGLLLSVVTLMVLPSDFIRLIASRAMPDMREAVAFGLAFLFAGLLSTALYETARGGLWWSAPLLGMLTSAMTFSLVFYPMAYSTDPTWASAMMADMATLSEMAIASLVPYWLLRAYLPPQGGFGGY